MVIQHNISALNSHRQLGINNSASAKNLEKLSSGYRVNRAGDDAAGLAISEKMRGQIRGLSMAEQNASNGISLIQTAEGGLNETHAILQRMRELAVQSANGTYEEQPDRFNLNKEVEAIKGELDRIASSTHYNGINLLDGSMGGKTVKTGNTAAQTTKMLEATGFGDATKVSGVHADIANETATFTIERGADGKILSAAMQVGDKTYMGSVSAGTGITFINDEDPAAPVDLAKLNFDAKFLETDTKRTSQVISGLTLGAAGADVELAKADKVIVADSSSKLVFQIGANGGADQRVGLHVGNMSSGALGNTETKIAEIDISTRDDANAAIEVIDAAINQVSSARADMGALQNRLEHTINNLGVTRENLTAAESSIRDVDMAKEMMEFTKNNILMQASQAMLAQSNQLPQGVLSLLATN